MSASLCEAWGHECLASSPRLACPKGAGAFQKLSRPHHAGPMVCPAQTLWSAPPMRKRVERMHQGPVGACAARVRGPLLSPRPVRWMSGESKAAHAVQRDGRGCDRAHHAVQRDGRGCDRAHHAVQRDGRGCNRAHHAGKAAPSVPPPGGDTRVCPRPCLCQCRGPQAPSPCLDAKCACCLWCLLSAGPQGACVRTDRHASHSRVHACRAPCHALRLVRASASRHPSCP